MGLLNRRTNAKPTAIDPAVDAVALDVSAANQTLDPNARGIYVGGAGNLVCRLVGGSADVTFTGLAAGQVYWIAIKTVVKAGTTVTNSLLLL